jgi:molybdenum cofactor cytidylyltransferase
MKIPLNRTAVILLASGLSRRFGWRDKLMAPLRGRPLLDHAASELAALQPLARIAVCPANRSSIAERLADRFVIAVNKKPFEGLGTSIAVGAQVAQQFKPEAVVFCMADMPFVEQQLVEDLVSKIGGAEQVQIAHAGGQDGVRPPTAFHASCLPQLQQLAGEDGARRLLTDSRFNVQAIEAPKPMLFDIDTQDDLRLADQQMEIRLRYRRA